MECQIVRQHLPAVCDGEQQQLPCFLAVAAHCLRCADCRAAWRCLKQDREVVRHLPSLPPPPALKSRILASLPPMVETAAPPQRRHPIRWLAPLVRWGSLGVALSVVLGLLLVLGHRADPVYAQLQRIASAYRQIQSAHYQGWYLAPDGRRIDIDAWYARPYRSWRRAGNELSRNDGTGEWTYVPGDRTAFYHPTVGLKAEAWQRLFDVERHLHQARRGLGVQDLGIEVINGVPQRKIRLSGAGYSERETWWLDLSTDLVRQQQTERREGPLSQQWRVVAQSTGIDYNRAAPQGLFTFTPPPGVQVVRLAPNGGGHFEKLLGDGHVLARRAAQGRNFSIELLAFHRSLRGDLFAVVRPHWFGSLGLVLTDADGGRYVGRGFHLGDRREKGYTTLFFPERSVPIRKGLDYELRVYEGDGIDDDPWMESASSPLLAVFEHLTPADGPASLDTLAEEFAQRRMDVTLGFLRASGLGLVALRQGRVAEAQAYLEDAVRQATNSNRDDTHAVYLELASLYAKGGRGDDARVMLRKAHDAATADVRDVRTVMRAAEAMERLGDRELARQWVEELLASREFGLSPGIVLKLAKKYEQLSGDPAAAQKYLVQRLAPWLREQPILGFGDAWEMGQALEAIGRNDLALEAYVKGLETTILKPYRESGGKLFREDAQKLISAIRRLGGEEAVKRLRVRPVPRED